MKKILPLFILIGMGYLTMRNKKSVNNFSIDETKTVNNIKINEDYIKNRMIEIYNKYNFKFPIKIAFTIVRTESNFKPNAKNPHSTAYGLFQMVNSTWNWSYQLCKKRGFKCSLRKDIIDNQIILGFTLIEHYWRIFKDPYKVLLAWCSPAEAYGKITKYHSYCKKITQIKWRVYNASM